MNYKKLFILLITIILLTGCSNKIDDYYTYINKDTIESYDITDSNSKSVFTIAQDKVDNEVKELIKNKLNNPTSSIDKEITNLYNLYLNDNNKSNGYNLISSYLNDIENISNIEEYIKYATKLENELNLNILTTFTISTDLKDNNRVVLYLYPMSYDYSLSSDYYTSSDYLYYHALIKQYNIKLLKQYGLSKTKSRTIAKEVDDLYKEIASVSKTSTDLNNIESYYNIISIDDLQSIYSKLNIKEYLSSKNLSNIESLSIVDKSNYEKLNSILTNDNLEALKYSMILKVLQTYGSYMNNDYYNIIKELNNKMSDEELTKEEEAYSIIETYFSNNINLSYTTTYFDNTKKDKITNLTNDIINVYREEINNNTWMSNDTKTNALKKLDNLSINIGYKEITNYESKISIDNSKSLIENLININKLINNYMIEELNNNKLDYEISQTTVNAYYLPQNNSINFPAATYNLVDENSNDYELLGTVGMIIAHEITHAFDPTGAKFDEYGNLNNWWTESDYEKFNAITTKVENYYSKYEVINGIYIDGEKTSGENIADMGAIETITKLASEKNATTEDYKTMYSAYAKLWASKYSDEYERLLLLQDTHSPNKYRVNGPLSSQNTFYDVYNIQKNDKMYIDRNDRVTIWS